MTEQRRLGRAQREGGASGPGCGDPEPHANLRSAGVPAKKQAHHLTPLQSTSLN